MASLHDILRPEVITGVVSREAAAASPLLSVFGFSPVRWNRDGTITDPGGAAQSIQGLRQFSYDIFNDTRTVGYSTAPGQPAATITRQAVGRVAGVYPQLYEKLPLPAEEMVNLRQIGGQPSEYGLRAMQDYLRRQQTFMAQRAANFRLLLLAGMIRGKLYAHGSGEKTWYDFNPSSATHTIDWKLPSGNTGQLNMLGTGNIIDTAWSNPSANIPKHLQDIDVAFQNLVGTRLDLVITTSAVWQHIINNDFVQEQAGAVNTPFEEFTRDTGLGVNGLPSTLKMGRLRCCPWIEFIITDQVLDLGLQGSTTRTKLIEDNHAWFGPRPTPGLFQMLVGGMPVTDRVGGPVRIAQGLEAWVMTTYDPAGQQLFVCDNAIPANYVPSASAYGQVSGF